jgi:signal transduction histidine kinase
LQGFGSLVKLLENVREFTRINDDALDLSSTEMEAFLRQTIAILLLEDGSLKCPIAVEVDPRFARLVIDRTRVRHAVTAAISNAMRASEKGSPITVRVRENKSPRADCNGNLSSSVSIEVQDSGCGMDTDTLRTATEPLFSGFSPPGLGLGLSVACLAAEIHGGELRLESELGGGTRVSLILPTSPLGCGCQP